MAGPSNLRRRQVNLSHEPTPDTVQDDEHVSDVHHDSVGFKNVRGATVTHVCEQRNRDPTEELLETPKASIIIVSILTALSFALRFYKINAPDEVV